MATDSPSLRLLCAAARLSAVTSPWLQVAGVLCAAHA